MKQLPNSIARKVSIGLPLLAAVAVCIANPIGPNRGNETTLSASTCQTCGGSGQQLASCAVCGGKGVSNTGNTCQSCGGSGKRYIVCRTCGGNGRLSAGSHLSAPGRAKGLDQPRETPLSSCGLKCIENCGASCTKARHHMGFHKCGNGHRF